MTTANGSNSAPFISDTSQPTSSVRHQFEGVQALRGYAAAIVVFHHFCWVIAHYHSAPSHINALARLAEVGASGVDVFFCISGLVITLSIKRLGQGIGPALVFLERRVARVVPIYWLYTSGLVALWALGIGLRGLIVTPLLLGSSYLLIPYPKTTIYGDVSLHPILDIGWTLTFEMYFYLVCGTVLAIAGGKRVFPWALVGLAMLAGVCLLAFGPRSVPATVMASPLLVEFTMGMFLARFAHVLLSVDQRTANLLGSALLMIGAVATWASAFLPDPMAMRLLVWGIPGAAMVLGAMMLQMPTSRWWRGAVYLGAASFTIYLAHPFATLAIGTLLKRGMFQSIDPDLAIVACTVATVLGTSVLYPLIEAPLTRLLQVRHSKT